MINSDKGSVSDKPDTEQPNNRCKGRGQQSDITIAPPIGSIGNQRYPRYKIQYHAKYIK